MENLIVASLPDMNWWRKRTQVFMAAALWVTPALRSFAKKLIADHAVERKRERVGEQVELISMLQRTQNINQHTIHIGNLFVHIHNTQWHCLQHTTSHKLHHACIMGQCFWQASVSQSSFSPHGHWSGSSLVLSSTMTEKHSALMCDLYFTYFYISYISYIYIFLMRDLYFIYDQMVHLSLSHFN